MTRMTLGDAAILALVAFLVLAAIGTVLDGIAKIRHRTLPEPAGDYCRADLELAVNVAVHRASVLRWRRPEAALELETRELVVEQVLEDLDAGHLRATTELDPIGGLR